MSLRSVFEPRRVAVVGASDQPGKVGSVVWSNLARFEGEVIPVTSSSNEVGGARARARLGDIEGPVDLAVLAIPSSAVPTVAAEAAAAGVGAIVVLSGGFAETGTEGAELQRQLVEAAGPVRIVGPNCFGVQNSAIGLNASIAAGSSVEPGGIALVTQSGAYGMAIHAMGADEHVRFGKVYASGNKADIDDAEVIAYLRDDPATTTICVFAESVGDGRALARAIRSTTPHKPVIITKTGRSDAGSRAARSHTGSLATSDVVFRAAMRQAGAVVVDSGLEMIDAARALAGQPLPRGARAAIITNSGGTGVELTDMLADEGIDVPELSAGLQRRIAERLPAFASPRNPVDMTPIWSRFAELYPWLVDTLARSGEVDIVIPILLQRSAMDPATVSAVERAVVRLRTDGVEVPVYVCWVAPRSVRSNADVLQASGVPCYEWPNRTAKAAGLAVRYAHTQRTIVPAPDEPVPAGAVLRPGHLHPAEAADLLETFGIRTAPTSVCHTAEEAVAAAAGVAGPVVMKTGDPSIAHRTERGGVRLGVQGDGSVRAAFAELGAPVLVQPQLAGVEVAVGAVNDAAFGPMVMTGLGGTTIELFGDVAFAAAPLGREEASALLGGLKSFPLLAGFRGAPACDLDALADLIAAVGDLMAGHPEIGELDLNPVMARPDGPIAVDWKVTVKEEDHDN